MVLALVQPHLPTAEVALTIAASIADQTFAPTATTDLLQKSVKLTQFL
ncbi:MAG: hypothetical protein N4J56_002156 [Chroococcidiopsis sp. SAG 2025]|nr:hypothetical protein [Chroococcidiopsis sp. SAG 2025]